MHARAALASLTGERQEGLPVETAGRSIGAGAGCRSVWRKFTPHMARYFGTGFAAAPVTLKTRMDIMDYADPKSNIRYEMSQCRNRGPRWGKIWGAGKPINKTK